MPTYSSNEDEINQLARLWNAPPAVDLDAARQAFPGPVRQEDIIARHSPISEDEARELLTDLQSSIERATAEQLNRLDNTEVETEEQIEARIEAVEALALAASRRQGLLADTYRGTRVMGENTDEAPVQESIEVNKEVNKTPVKRKSRYQILKESVRPETQSEDSQALHRKISWEKDTTV